MSSRSKRKQQSTSAPTIHLVDRDALSTRLDEMVKQIDPDARLEPEVSNLLLEVAEDFVESVASFACSLAKHRGDTLLTAEDVMLHLERNWDIKVPLALKEKEPDAGPSKKRATESHRVRMTLINDAKRKLASEKNQLKELGPVGSGADKGDKEKEKSGKD